MIVVPAGVKVHLALGYAEMRSGLGGRETLIQEQLRLVRRNASGNHFSLADSRTR